jgi:hypothetical protein
MEQRRVIAMDIGVAQIDGEPPDIEPEMACIGLGGQDERRDGGCPVIAAVLDALGVYL